MTNSSNSLEAGLQPSATGDVELGHQPSVELESKAGGASRADLLTHRHGAPTSTEDAENGSAPDSPDPAKADSKSIPASEASGDEWEIKPATYWEVAKHFGILGCTAFGGPAAHVSMFLKVGCVCKRGAGRGLLDRRRVQPAGTHLHRKRGGRSAWGTLCPDAPLAVFSPKQKINPCLFQQHSHPHHTNHRPPTHPPTRTPPPTPPHAAPPRPSHYFSPVHCPSPSPFPLAALCREAALDHPPGVH